MKDAIKQAFINHRQDPSWRAHGSHAGGLSWVARVKISGHEMKIDGLGDGDVSPVGIATAFPSVDRRFKDHD